VDVKRGLSCQEKNSFIVNSILRSVWNVINFFCSSNLNAVILLVLSVAMIMTRMIHLRDITAFVVGQKIHHFIPGWYHILVGRHVERPCSHSVDITACFFVTQVITVNVFYVLYIMEIKFSSVLSVQVCCDIISNDMYYTCPLLLPCRSLVVLAREHWVPHLREYAC
jgi:hypothetical protein